MEISFPLRLHARVRARTIIRKGLSGLAETARLFRCGPPRSKRTSGKLKARALLLSSPLFNGSEETIKLRAFPNLFAKHGGEISEHIALDDHVRGSVC